jgi:hypothetical protein
MGISLSKLTWYPFGMGKKVENEDYAKPLFTRIYRRHRVMLDELVASFPLIHFKYPKKDGPTERSITDTEVVQIAIEDLHQKRVVANDTK